ncbi:hypothetical protein BpHYR1_054409 [Brachionus plicatilis]|uniref:Uncharacterized protein n=1 Tax=Brachionus plicatilis TaxID=10195 RepID=A0A3M7PY06_BRAPC|nr:hypothetical protein BpHYR1_054409 [Brachionus plicatilis]
MYLKGEEENMRSKKEMLTKLLIFILYYIVQRFICGITCKEKELDCPNPNSFQYEISHFYHNSYPCNVSITYIELDLYHLCLANT